MAQDHAHYMVQQPGTRMKTWDAASPTSPQRNEAPSPLASTCVPNFLSSPATRSEGVIPRAAWDLTDAVKLVAMSSNASASATCSLGFSTAVEDNTGQLFLFCNQQLRAVLLLVPDQR
jgi:hypothetical protein